MWVGGSLWRSPRVQAFWRAGAGLSSRWAWDQGSGRGGSDPKGVVSGSGAGVLKGQQEKDRRVRAGASSLARGPGEGYRDRSGGNHRAPFATTAYGEQSNSLWLLKEREGARFRFPAKSCPPTPATSGPARTHLAPAARSGTAPPRWAGGGAGAGTQIGSALPLQDWFLRIVFPFHWLL